MAGGIVKEKQNVVLQKKKKATNTDYVFNIVQ
jgi:hypothetical protein